MNGSLRAIFLAPLVIAVLALVGLIGALIGDGAWDGVGWLTLGLPLVWAAVVYVRRRR